MPRLRNLLLLCALPLLWACGGGHSLRSDVQGFILETLRKKEGDAWERTGQYMIWTYRFDRSGCELSVQREAELGDFLQQRIPLAKASVVGTQNSEIVFDCRSGEPCVDYLIKNTQRSDQQRVARTRLLVMDSEDLTPLMNAFAELHQLCRDPYAPSRSR